MGASISEGVNRLFLYGDAARPDLQNGGAVRLGQLGDPRDALERTTLEVAVAGDSSRRVQLGEQRCAGGDVQLQNLLPRQLFQFHDQRAQTVPMGGNENRFPGQQAGFDDFLIVG